VELQLRRQSQRRIQPLVYKGVLYVTTNSATMAVDAKTGRQIWKTKVEYPPELRASSAAASSTVAARCMTARSSHHARRQRDRARCPDRQELWRKNAIDFKAGYSMTVAPLIADGVLITGISGAEFGTRDFIDGWDPKTGEHLCAPTPCPQPASPETTRGRVTPGSSAADRPGSPDRSIRSCTRSYWGIGNPGPFNAAGRPGDNLYTCSVLRLDPKSGKIKWHYQFSPNNPFDYDAVAEMVLATLDIDGKPTPVLMDANRNGFFYVLDRTNGKLLAANPYVKVNWASSIRHEDRPSGRDRRERQSPRR